MSRSGGIDPRDRPRAATTLMLARVVYAFNWYNIGAVLPFVGHSLSLSTFELGVVLGAFLVGAGIFQIPAGLAAMRWGNRTISLFALFLMGIFSLASAFSTNWLELVGTRFGAGAGAAFFFSPALGLIASYYPTGEQGPMIGLFNSGFSIGSGAGLFGGYIVGELYGWPWALAIGGIALLVIALIGPATLPRTAVRRPARPLRELWLAADPVLRSRSLWALALGTSGLWAAYYVAAQYFIEFAHEVHPGWAGLLAALAPVVMIVLEVPGGPIGGWMGERSSNFRRLLLGWGILSGIGILAIPLLPLSALLGLFALLGFADGVVFAILYLVPAYLPESHGESLSLGLATVNSIQIFLGSALAIVFGYLAGTVGYEYAWWFAGAIGLAPLPLLAWVGARGGDARAFVRPRARGPRAVRFPDRPG